MKNVIVITIILVAMIALFSCTEKRTANQHSTTTVVSLAEHIDEIDLTAKKWDEDAYLHFAEVSIYSSQWEDATWLIVANFQSVNKENQSLNVYIGLDGNLSTSYVEHKIPVNQIQPITRSDWPVDSDEALELLRNDTTTDHVASGGRAFLTLERVLSEIGQPVVWRLTLSKDDGALYFYIDATTGKLLEINR